MKKVDSVYVMKCRDAKDPYPHIVNGNFRKLESVMEKAEELKQNSTTTQIDVWLKTKEDNKKVYNWTRDFEVVYLRQGA